MNRPLFTLLAIASLSATHPAHAENLVDIYAQAKASDPTLAAARSAHAATQEKLPQGRALLLPSAAFNANANHSNTDTSYNGSNSAFRFGGGNQSFETYSYSVNASQPIYRKQNRVQYEEAKTQVMQAEEQLTSAEQELMLRTSQTYFDVLLAQDKLKLIYAQKAAVEQQLEQAKANFDVGTATITDVDEAQARYDLLLAQEIAAQNDVHVRRHAIQAITGQMPGELVSAREDLKATIPAPQNMDEWVSIAGQQNKELRIQQYNLTLASQEIERAHAGHYPTLDLVGSYTDTYSNGGSNGFGADQQDFTIGLQLQVPIYQGGAIVSQEREAVANKQRALDNISFARRQAELQTRQAYLEVASAVAQVKAFEQALVSSQSQLDSTNLGYEVGVRTSVDVLNAQQQLYSAKRDLLQARYTWLLSIIKLKSAAGVLVENDLDEINRLLSGS